MTKTTDWRLVGFLLVDVPLGNNQDALKVAVVKFPGVPTKDDQDEADEVEARTRFGTPESLEGCRDQTRSHCRIGLTRSPMLIAFRPEISAFLLRAR